MTKYSFYLQKDITDKNLVHRLYSYVFRHNLLATDNDQANRPKKLPKYRNFTSFLSVVTFWT